MSDIIDRLHGIFVPIVTPLTGGGEIDLGSLRGLAGYLADAGVHGLFVMGTTGEFPYIGAEDQWEGIKTVVEEVGDRTVVVAGVSGDSIEDTVRNIVVLNNSPNPPHALVIAPLCYHSNRKLPLHMDRLCNITRLPVLLYNNIGIVKRRWKRKDILPELVGRIAKQGKILGIKDSSGNLNYLEQILVHQSDAFKAFQGEESQMLSALQLGAVGAVPSIGNILPDVCVGLYRSYKDYDVESARKYQKIIIETHDLYLRYGNIPGVLKQYLARKGIIATGNSFLPFDGEINRVIDRLEDRINA